jgi:hypothetical protein
MDLVEVVTAGVDAIDFLHSETSRLYRLADTGPSAGSFADQEARIADGLEMLQTAFSQGAMLLEVTADQATACQKTLTNPVQTIAPWTCARSAMESSALGCWLMDTAVQREERIQRSFAYRYEGLVQQEKYFRAKGLAAAAQAVSARIDKVEHDAAALGYEPVLDKRGRRIGIGQQMPTTTAVIAQCLHKGNRYRLFSGIAHAHFWALKNLSLQVATRPPAAAVNASVTKGAYLEKALDPRAVALLVADVLDSLARVVSARFRLYGWDFDGLRQALEAVYDKMRLSDQARFWRNT